MRNAFFVALILTLAACASHTGAHPKAVAWLGPRSKFLSGHTSALRRPASDDHGAPAALEEPVSDASLEQDVKTLQGWSPYLVALKAKIGAENYTAFMNSLSYDDPEIFAKLGEKYLKSFPKDAAKIAALKSHIPLLLNRDTVYNNETLAKVHLELSGPQGNGLDVPTLKIDVVVSFYQNYFDQLKNKMNNGDLSPGALLALAMAGPRIPIYAVDPNADIDRLNRATANAFNTFGRAFAAKYKIEPLLVTDESK